MVAVAVRRLDKDDVRCNRSRRIGKDRPVVTPEVTAEENRRATCQSNDDERRAQQVTGRVIFNRDPRHHVDRPLVSEWLQLRQRSKGVALCEQWERWMMLRVAVLVGLPRV